MSDFTSPFYNCELVGYQNMEVCNIWPVRCQTNGYVTSCGSSLLIDQYQIILTARWLGHKHVNNLCIVVMHPRLCAATWLWIRCLLCHCITLTCVVS